MTVPRGVGPQPSGYVLAPGEGTSAWFLTNRLTVKAGAESTGGRLTVIERRLQPGFGPPLHLHRDHDEALFVVEGSLLSMLEGTTQQAPAGSFIFVPRGSEHTFHVQEGGIARIIEIILPGGLEHYFLEGGRLATDDSVPTDFDPSDMDRIRALHDRYDSVHVGPPLAAGTANGPMNKPD
jgi:quercetin dioxygenase-like cupin family protein